MQATEPCCAVFCVGSEMAPQALAACKRLLQSEGALRPEYRYLAYTYAAEALCWLGDDRCEEVSDMFWIFWHASARATDCLVAMSGRG